MSARGTCPLTPNPSPPFPGARGGLCVFELQWKARVAPLAPGRGEPARSGFRDEHEGEQVCAASLTGRVARGSRDQQLRVGLRNLFHRQIVLVIKQQSAG